MIINKTIKISLIQIIIFNFFVILVIILFLKKKKKLVNKLKKKILIYKDKNNLLKKTNNLLLFKIKNIIPKIYEYSNHITPTLGSHNSSHSNPIQPTWLQ